MNAPAVSVIMTVWREPFDRLDGAVAAAVAGRQPSEVEVVVAGDAADPTLRELADRWSDYVRIIDNPSGNRSVGLNAAIRAASHDIVCRVDARSRVPDGYVSRVTRRLVCDQRIGAVGGHQVAVACNPDARSRGIARALRNPFLLGGAAYRRPDKWGEADTVYLGAWRREEILALGGFDERLEANEDFDLFRRIADGGRVVWLEKGLDVPYLSRTQYVDLWQQYRTFGRWKVRFWRLTGNRPNARQLGAFAGAAVGIGAGVALLARPRHAARAGGVALVTLATLDHLAAPDGGPGERLTALGAYVVVLNGWILGAVEELLRAPARRNA